MCHDTVIHWAYSKSQIIFSKRIKSIEINWIITSLLSISMIDVRCVPIIRNFAKNIICDKNSCCFVEIRRPNKCARKFYLIVWTVRRSEAVGVSDAIELNVSNRLAFKCNQIFSVIVLIHLASSFLFTLTQVVAE